MQFKVVFLNLRKRKNFMIYLLTLMKPAILLIVLRMIQF